MQRPGVHEVDRCIVCDEWVPIWRWALHTQAPGEHRAPERGPLARERAQAAADAARTERAIAEEEMKIATYAFHGPSPHQLHMLEHWRSDLERFHRRAAGDFSDRRDDVLLCAETPYEPPPGPYQLRSPDQAAQLLGVPVEHVHAGITAGRIRTEARCVGGPRYVPSYELARLRELVAHAAWRRRHQDDPIQRWRRARDQHVKDS